MKNRQAVIIYMYSWYSVVLVSMILLFCNYLWVTSDIQNEVSHLTILLATCFKCLFILFLFYFSHQLIKILSKLQASDPQLAKLLADQVGHNWHTNYFQELPVWDPKSTLQVFQQHPLELEACVIIVEGIWSSIRVCIVIHKTVLVY